MDTGQASFLRQLFLTLTIFFATSALLAQTNSFNEVESDLVRTSSKIFPYYYGDSDSLEFYSKLFTSNLIDFISQNPATLDYPFQMFADSLACDIVTSSDGLFRIYSWDTWLGGTMHIYKNLFQFKSGDKVFLTDLGYGDDDIGTSANAIYTVKANDKTYYLALSGGSESSRYYYETISIYTIDGSTLNDTIALIKTPEGLKNYINFEYDFSSVYDRPERPLRLMKYDADKKIIYVPIVFEDGKVTDRFILYQFKGQYFEHIQTQK